MDTEEDSPQEELFSLMGDEDTDLQQNIADIEVIPRAPVDKAGKTLQTALAQKEETLQQAEKKYIYLLAEFENYKKRVQREQVEQTKFANERLLKEMLVVLDDLERAIVHSKETPDSKKITEGVEITLKQCLSCLGRYGVTPIDAMGKPFDPAYHQAVGYREQSGCEANQVIEEVQKGYRLHDRVLRATMVLISQTPVIAPEQKMDSVREGQNMLGEAIDRIV